MPIDKRIGSAAQALADVGDGATVLISGFGGAGFPNLLIRALCERAAKDLTLVVNSATHRYSLTHELIEAGLVRKVVCSAARGRDKELSAFERLWVAGKIELVCLPQGTFAEAIRAGGAGIGGFYTRVGAGTLLAEGKEERVIGGVRHVLEEPIYADVSLVYAARADELGNLWYRRTARNFNPLMATAATVTIAEAGEIVPVGALEPESVVTPHLYVDRLVPAA